MSFMTPPNPTRLGTVRNRGGKIMVYHGVSDAIFSIDDTKAWYDVLRANHCGDASNFARFLAMPGMGHCSGGPATDQFDMLSQLVAWVEQGQAPDKVVARARGAGSAGGADADEPAGRPAAPGRCAPTRRWPATRGRATSKAPTASAASDAAPRGDLTREREDPLPAASDQTTVCASLPLR